MKKIPFKGRRLQPGAGLQGVALLLVLASIVLLAVLILAFLNGTRTDLISSKSFANSSAVKTLADSTVNLVTAQIRQATSGQDANGNPLAWASQPGMIRTYDDGGRRVANYKLYSWETLKTTGVFDPSSSQEKVPDDWHANTALFTDLNKPVADSSGTKQYPILDPPPAPSSTINADSQPHYVEGFDVDANAPVQPSNGNTVPMPVKWLYVLENGKMVAPTSTGSGNQVQVPGADQSPIVGRVAFWTDDESCKININTASEGSFWDTPRAQGVTDFNAATYQPTQNEYQRYPGHPATTCLSTVFGSLFPVDHNRQASNSAASYTSPKPLVYSQFQPYYDLAPKLNKNTIGNLGSKAGTVTATTNTSTPPVLLKPDRLYASVEELLFKSNLISDDTHDTAFNGVRPDTEAKLDKTMLAKAKFFLTAGSRSPDVNLFNKPRISVWPIHVNNNSTYRTPYDQTIAFCATINKFPYHFVRERNDHPTNDLPAVASSSGLGRNRMLMQYLQSLTSADIPGFGGKFSSKYGYSGSVSERDQILTEIFDYIRCLNLTDQSDSAMTRPFAPVALTSQGYSIKYANTDGFGNSSIATPLAGAGQVVPIHDTNNQTKGFGRFPTVSEVSLIFIVTGWNDGRGGLATDVNYQSSPTPNAGNGNTGMLATGGYAPWGYYNDGTNTRTATVPPSPSGGVIPGGHVQVQAAILVNLFDPSQGNVPAHGTYCIQITGLDNFRWGVNSGSVSPMGFPSTSPANATNMMPSGGGAQYTVSWGGNLGFRSLFAWMQAGKTASPRNWQYYPFFSSARNFPYDPDTPRASDPSKSPSPGTFFFSGGDIKIHFLLPPNTPNYPPAGWPVKPSDAARAPIQTLALSLPPATLPLPLYAPPGKHNSEKNPVYQNRGSFGVRFGYNIYNYASNAMFITAQDTVRSVRAYPGDIRMIAGKQMISDTDNTPAPAPGYFDIKQTHIKNAGMQNWNYFSSTQRLVHSLRESVDYPFWGALLGNLVPGITYAGQPADGAAFTDYSSGLNTFSGAGNNPTPAGAFIGGGITGVPGDWDNGFGYTADGPYINKPDEGNLNFGQGVPYFGGSNYLYSPAGETYFSPNRLMPSPAMFGSLSSGVARNIPWQTLLFCPNPAAGESHPGFGSGQDGSGPKAQPPFSDPPDHLLLDLFTMPVVEPYPITEPLSTAGRINMNYQIVPFTYITRNTGLRAVLKSERITAIPDSAASAYKAGGGTSFALNKNYDYRVPINLDETLKGFAHYFRTNKDIFRSPSQICSMFLYPDRYARLTSISGPTWDSTNFNISMFWNGSVNGAYNVNTSPANPTHYLTGDNSRERPYATIYPRLTTKSNTYTIHVCVQTLKKAKNSPANIWRDGKDVVTGEYRGSSTIERYIDPNDPDLPDFANPQNDSEILEPHYKYRILATRQFAP